MVAQVQLVASIGAAASVLNLGVSAGRFAMVLLSLKRMESKIEDISTELQVLAMHHDASFLGRCSHALRRADEAFSLVAPAERRRYWQEADKDLGLLIEEGLQIIEGQGLPLEGPSSTAMTGESRLRTLSVPAVVETLRWLATFSTARAEVLLCLGHARLAGQVSARLADWLAPLPRSAKELAMAQLAGRTLAPSQVQSVTRLAKATSSLVADGHQVAAARAALCHDLETAGVDTTEHMLRLRDDPNAQVLAWTAHR
ncbi:hypothetical protein ISF6_5019 [Piscinibacter sakaiensis]|uniref:Uncharacterized protein n=2 Tax=Piscinibacter sakaiensis TaxID=1547922 RepID=A0A0K8P7F5_PISS1|nr:hypothetical protein ISF6_5019 [Piscinibacter sakaiensis]